ncbi:MAG: dihydrodipicolinate synthase family protein [Bryobacter sp.]
MTQAELLSRLQSGLVIPAHPLALDADRQLDPERQCGLTRYYADCGAGGIAVGVHTTQFAIREKGLYPEVLRLARASWPQDRVAVAGVCGKTAQATSEAALAAHLGYHTVLLNLSAWCGESQESILDHCRTVGEILPLFGFYLQPSVGGMNLDYAFWRGFAELECVVALKVAPFHRYRTLDVVRAVAEAGRASDLALYTGNDDNILVDLLTRFEFGGQTLHFAGGLLGQWAVWTRRAVAMLEDVKRLRASGAAIPAEWLTLAAALTDANGALFDVRNNFAGCIAGIHEILRREGLLEGTWCLDRAETLGPGQLEEIERVLAAYPQLR